MRSVLAIALLCLCAFYAPALAQDDCSLCTFVVNYAEGFLAQNSTQEEIEAGLDSVCDLLGGESTTCKQFVSDYLPAIITWIQNNENGQTFCTQIGLCSSTKVPAALPKPNAGDDCSMCTFVVNYVEGYIAQNATEQEIETALDNVCNLLGSESATCKQFVDDYLPAIITWVQNNENGQTFCTQIGLCSSAVKPKPQSGVDCSFCEVAVGWIEGYLAQNSTEAEIEAALQKVCAATPFVSECDTFVDDYVPVIIQYLKNDENPDTICTQIGLCTSSTVSVSGKKAAVSIN